MQQLNAMHQFDIYYISFCHLVIHLFVHIFSYLDHIKTMSSDLESSHDALSISTITKAKHQSFCQSTQLNRPLESAYVEPQARLTFHSILQKERITMRPRHHYNRHFELLDSSISAIITARPRHGIARTRKTHS